MKRTISRMQMYTALMTAALLLTAGCGPRKLRAAPNSCSNAPAELRQTWASLQEARAEKDGCAGVNAGRCEQLRLRIDYLGQNCPANAEALLAGAILAYDDKALSKAQGLLDALMASYSPHPEAAVLRARIAIDEGNIPFARRFLADQIEVTGNHPGLREMYASTLYLSGAGAAAVSQLQFARQLGAPAWRIEYGLGLIAESDNRLAEARGHFEAALKAQPGWKMAMARLQALELHSPGK